MNLTSFFFQKKEKKPDRFHCRWHSVIFAPVYVWNEKRWTISDERWFEINYYLDHFNWIFDFSHQAKCCLTHGTNAFKMACLVTKLHSNKTWNAIKFVISILIELNTHVYHRISRNIIHTHTRTHWHIRWNRHLSQYHEM